jgi:hypothetical protein
VEGRGPRNLSGIEAYLAFAEWRPENKAAYAQFMDGISTEERQEAVILSAELMLKTMRRNSDETRE